MATMDAFDHILNWKLKEGSHPFPGKDGGTCIDAKRLWSLVALIRRVGGHAEACPLSG